jgi:cell division protease FtsH
MDDFALNTYIKDHIDKNEQIILQGADYSKSLIFVCGNLDNAYSMARSVSDADSDADILHEYSKRISIIDIKQCLGLMFKPEQIARLGNSHIIYPCLNRENYMELIYRNMNSYLDTIAEKTGVKVTYSDKLVDKLYANYVYPSQGVRPLYSSICSFISNVLPTFLLDALCKKWTSIDIDVIGTKGNIISCTFPDGSIVERKYEFELDNIKTYIDADKLMLYSVHESSHALVYAYLFGYAPKLINVELTSHDGAYILPNEMIPTKQVILDMVVVYLAGAVAERLFFGDMNLSSGCANDIKQGTQQVSRMIRQFGMLDDMVRVDSLSSDHAAFVNTDIDGTNDTVTKIMNECRDRAEIIIKANSTALKHIINVVKTEKKVSGRAFAELVEPYFPNIKHIDPLDDIGRHEISPKYVELFEEKSRQL